MASDSEDKASSEHPHSGNFFLRPPLSGSVPLSASAPGASTMLQKAVHRARTTAASFAAGTVTGLNSLSGSPPELWKAYVLKFLDSYAYFSFSLIFTLFLSDEFGMSDVEAGTYYGVWGALVTVFGLFTGTIIDNLGVAKCLRIGFVLSLLSRVGILLATSKTPLLFCILFTLPLSNCLGIPVLTIGLRRYTNESNRGFAFGLFYVVMNVGALLAGPLVDRLTYYYNHREDGGDMLVEDDDPYQSTGGWVMTNNRAIVLSGVVANVLAVLVAFTVREIKVDADDAGRELVPSSSDEVFDDDDDGPHRVPSSGSMGSVSSRSSATGGGDSTTRRRSGGGPVRKFEPLKGSTFRILADTLAQPSFRRFLVVCLLTLNVRMVFRHLDGTLPKYMVREFGPDAPKGRVYSINPALIIVLVPIITASTSAVDPLVMIHHGTYVSALSVFFLACSTSMPACVLFVVTLSIGEAIWSPRLYDYAMSVSPEGREGTYMALSSAPLFLAKLPVGFVSGLLLQRYCPEEVGDGEVRHSRTMWLIIGLSTVVSPIMTTVLWGYISGRDSDKKEEGRDDRRGEDGAGYYQHTPLKQQISLPRVPRPNPIV